MPTATGTTLRPIGELTELIAPHALQVVQALGAVNGVSPQQALNAVRNVLDAIEAESIAPCGCERQGPTISHDHRWCAIDPVRAAHALADLLGEPEPDDDPEPDHSDVVNDGDDYGCPRCCSPEGCGWCRPWA